MKYAFYTLGCKVNQYETQAMQQELLRRGHTLGDFDEPCDCCIINTCTVTAVADKKNRNIIRRCRKQNPEAVIGVCGCYAQMAPEELRKLGVDVIAGSGDRMAFLDLMEQAAREHVRLESVDRARERFAFEPLPSGSLAERTRAMLKVQDGCNHFCSYCIIPFARGPVRSLPLEDAAAQVVRLRGEGYREIIITGIEIASWGEDLPGNPKLTELLTAILDAAPELRIRLGSLEPRIIDEDFCRTLQGYPNLCPQFHLSMQSGCDTVLKRMNRHYDTARFYRSVELLRDAFPGCAITTDMIVAFPGETEEEFEQSLAFLRKCAFSAMHIFPYSRRPGTVADRMPGQHSNAVKQDRSARAIAVAKELQAAYLQSLVGSVQAVLFEEADGAYQTGHAPNGVRVWAEGGDLHNQVRQVRIGAPYQDGVLGVVED